MTTEVFKFDHLFKRFEETGQEVTKIFLSHRNKKLGFLPLKKNPLDLLCQKGMITREQLVAGKHYQCDYELSNMTLHSRPNYDGVFVDGGKLTVREVKDAQIVASKNVAEIKRRLEEKEMGVDKYNQARGARKKPRKYLKVLRYLVEKEMAIRNVNLMLGFHPNKPKNCEIRAREVLSVIEKFYNS